MDAKLGVRLPVEDRPFGDIAQRPARRDRLLDLGDDADREALARIQPQHLAPDLGLHLGGGRGLPLPVELEQALCLGQVRRLAGSTPRLVVLAPLRPLWLVSLVCRRRARGRSVATGTPLSMP